MLVLGDDKNAGDRDGDADDAAPYPYAHFTLGLYICQTKNARKGIGVTLSITSSGPAELSPAGGQKLWDGGEIGHDAGLPA